MVLSLALSLRGEAGQGQLVAEAAVDPRERLPASETRWETHMHRDVHTRCREGQLLAPTCHCAREFAKLLSQMATSHSNQTPITKKALDCDLPFSSQPGARLPGALLSISLQGQGPLFCSSHLLCPSLFGQFL